MVSKRSTRRRYLAGVGVAVSGLAAGCTDDAGSGNGNGGGGATADAPSEVEITSSAFVPESHPFGETFGFLRDRVNELTGDRVNWNDFPGGQLGGPDGILDRLNQGTTDLAFHSPAYTHSVAPLTTVQLLPTIYETSMQSSKALSALIEDRLQEEEWDQHNAEVLGFVALPPVQLIANMRVDELSDWEGLKLRAPGGTASSVVRTLGGTPTQMPSGDAYTAMQRGTIDGSISGLYTFDAYGFHEVVSHATKNASFYGGGGLYVMNQDRMAELPEAVTDAIRQAGQESIEFGANIFAEQRQSNIDKHSDEVEIYDVPEAELDRWYDEMDPTVFDQWAEDHGGQAAQELIPVWRDYCAEYAP